MSEFESIDRFSAIVGSMSSAPPARASSPVTTPSRSPREQRPLGNETVEPGHRVAVGPCAPAQAPAPDPIVLSRGAK
jgi:hypothetical protein